MASSIKWGIGGEKAGDIDASTEKLKAGRRRVTLAEMTNASERALAAANLMTQQSEPFLPHQSAQLPLASSAASRRVDGGSGGAAAAGPLRDRELENFVGSRFTPACNTSMAAVVRITWYDGM